MTWLLPLIYDRFMLASEQACLSHWRAELLSGLGGDVLEVGAGTGANLAFYPAGTRLVVTEPDARMLTKLTRRPPPPGLASLRAIEANAEDLPLPDGSFDAVVSTLVLCSVRDVRAALGEFRRVLRPGRSLIFLEHVAAEERSGRRKWQERIEPVWKRLAGNCHLTRTTEEAIVDAGFTVERITRESMRKALPIVRPTIRGIARAPAAAGE